MMFVVVALVIFVMRVGVFVMMVAMASVFSRRFIVTSVVVVTVVVAVMVSIVVAVVIIIVAIVVVGIRCRSRAVVGRVERIRSVAQFVTVIDTTTVGIGIGGIGAYLSFIVVGESITVGVAAADGSYCRSQFRHITKLHLCAAKHEDHGGCAEEEERKRNESIYVFHEVRLSITIVRRNSQTLDGCQNIGRVSGSNALEKGTEAGGGRS